MNGTVYHFWSPTCNPCKVIKPVIEDLKEITEKTLYEILLSESICPKIVTE